ncbi:hypothetical protein LCGC14_2659180 [marine sediment metagenome]|uniref:Uncharacterized protein n=2 Tax=root TaxID=1 RepID=A0A7V1D0Z6_9GAMM|nr:hypothetical protein [Pseudoalteromonas prydzensis]HEA17700.1 hypothetical protein [Pseudoalteromonas prydzensis]
MDIKISESNKKQVNDLAEKILKSLADIFPIGIHPTAKNFGVSNECLEGVLAYLVHSDYLFSPEENIYYLTETTLAKIKTASPLNPMKIIIK